MLSTLALLVSTFFALFVAAVPLPGGTMPASQCNTGILQCCQSTYQSNSTTGAFLLGAVGIPIQNVVTSVGFDCSPITLSALGAAAGSAAQCATQPVCCNQNNIGGSNSMVTNGCSPSSLQV
ncbi:fungal hydrophobin [Tricholoma matsutake]|nr:fungal hydrophobin [Tricholoma matsutake 945]